MIVVTANWGIGDGSLWTSLSAAAVERFVRALQRAAVRAGWRPDGSYAPVERIDLLLAGDTFDWLASRIMLATVRPWRRGVHARDSRDRAMAATVRMARRTLGPLLRAVRRGVAVPSADRRGRPRLADWSTAALEVTLLEGNLDRGLAGPVGVSLAAAARLRVGEHWFGGGVSVLHGDDADPLWGGFDPAAGPRFRSDDGRPSLGESLHVDLLGRFALAPAVASLPAADRDVLLSALSREQPLAWGGRLEARLRARSEADGAIAAAWRASVDAWHREARGAGVAAEAPFDVLDSIADRMILGTKPGNGGVEADPLGDLLQPQAAATIGAAVCRGHSGRWAGGDAATILLGHHAVSASGPVSAGRMVYGLADGPLPERPATCDTAASVREIGPPAATRAFPRAMIVAVEPGGPVAVRSLGEPVPEWEAGSRRDHRWPDAAPRTPVAPMIVDAA